MSKITQEELDALNENIKFNNEVLAAISEVEVRKSDLLDNFKAGRNALNEKMKSLEEKYGKIELNLQDGSYVESDDSNGEETD